MKHLLIILLMILLSGCGVTQPETEPQFIPSGLTFEEMSANMTSIRIIHDVASTEIRYVSDPEDGSGENRSPQKTWELRYGDCEDYAIFCAYFVKKLGYEYNIIFVYSDNSGHAVTAWKVGEGQYQFSSNGSIRQVIYNSYEEIARAVKPNYILFGMYKVEDLIK